MRHAAVIAIIFWGLAVGANAADLHKTIQGQWMVDERARLEASPLYALSPPERKKVLEESMKTVAATRFVFTDTTLLVVGGEPVAYRILKRTPTSLILESSASSDGLMPKDEITIVYVSDASLKMTAKSQGLTLVLNRVK
ncbi:MAG: hypothetical protein ABI593_12710 [Betaproteobacteria bacterium]